MKVPYTVNAKILELYQPPKLPLRSRRKIFAEDFHRWHETIPEPLAALCVRTIAHNWPSASPTSALPRRSPSDNPLFKEIPQLSDRLFLLEILPVDLPLELAVPLIHEDVYWKRCFAERWPKKLPKSFFADTAYPTGSSRGGSPVSESSLDAELNSWKRWYLEMHLKETLEDLPPEEYDSEKMKVLSEICRPYASKLNLTQMQCPLRGCEHVPLSAIISSLENLTEISITFQQTYIKDAFSWDIFKTSLQDVKHLCKALENASKLRVLRITKSDIDCEKFKLLLKSLQDNDCLKEVDFAHCKISDEGILALSKVLSEKSFLHKAIFSNNKIGFKGAKALSYAISQPACSLLHLDVRLNNIGSAGGKCLIDTLKSSAVRLKELTIAACEIRSSETIFSEMLARNRTLASLNLSNNRFGEEVGKDILKGLENNTTLTELDLRMCDISSSTKHAIRLMIVKNGKRPKAGAEEDDKAVEGAEVWDENFVSAIQSAFN